MTVKPRKGTRKGVPRKRVNFPGAAPREANFHRHRLAELRRAILKHSGVVALRPSCRTISEAGLLGSPVCPAAQLLPVRCRAPTQTRYRSPHPGRRGLLPLRIRSRAHIPPSLLNIKQPEHPPTGAAGDPNPDLPSCWQLLLLFPSLRRCFRREAGTAGDGREDRDARHRREFLGAAAHAEPRSAGGPGGARRRWLRRGGKAGGAPVPGSVSPRGQRPNQLAPWPGSLVRKGTLQAGGRLLSLWCDRSSCPGRDSVFLKRGCSERQGLPLPPISSPSSGPLPMCWQSLQSSQTFPVCAWLSWVALEVVPAGSRSALGRMGCCVSQ